MPAFAFFTAVCMNEKKKTDKTLEYCKMHNIGYQANRYIDTFYSLKADLELENCKSMMQYSLYLRFIP